MAELLVRVVDKPWEIRSWRYTPLRWRYYTKAGDVIVAVPNGHKWGREEVRAHYWRVFCLPEYPSELFQDMFEAELHWNEHVQTRVRYFDLTGPWVRGLILSGQVICMTGDDAKRFLRLKRYHASAIPAMVA